MVGFDVYVRCGWNSIIDERRCVVLHQQRSGLEALSNSNNAEFFSVSGRKVRRHEAGGNEVKEIACQVA